MGYLGELKGLILEVLLPFGVVFGMFALVAIGITEVGGRYSCANYERITGLETEWVLADACFVKAAGGWERWDEYKYRAATNERKGSN